VSSWQWIHQLCGVTYVFRIHKWLRIKGCWHLHVGAHCTALCRLVAIVVLLQKFIVIELVSKLRSCYGTETYQVNSSGNASYESLGCARFESGLGHRLRRIQIFVVFLSPIFELIFISQVFIKLNMGDICITSVGRPFRSQPYWQITDSSNMRSFMNSCRPVSNRSPDFGEIWYERYVYHTKRPFFSVMLTNSKT